jgi:nucleoside-diphosphate-sugar epimerase
VAAGKRLVSGTKLRFVNVKLEHMFGPQDDDSKFTTRVIQSCLANVESFDLTPGEQRRDFIYIDDVVAGYTILLREVSQLPLGFTEYELGSGNAVSVREFVESVRRIAGSSTDLRFGAVPYREGEVMLSCADTSRMRALGWQPGWSLEDGLRETLSWYARREDGRKP